PPPSSVRVMVHAPSAGIPILGAGAPLVIRRDTALAAVSPSSIVEGGFGDPEVEVIGADLEPGGDGALAVIRRASPEALAALRVTGSSGAEARAPSWSRW